MVTILISAEFRAAVLIRGEALISMLTPKSAGLITGWRLFEARCLLKERQLSLVKETI